MRLIFTEMTRTDLMVYVTFDLSQRKRKLSLARNGENAHSRLREKYEAEHRANKGKTSLEKGS